MNIILYVLDALRPDHLGCYGYERQTSPNIDALAADGAVFENCFTSSTWTRPVAASILTGTYPGVHKTSFRNHMFSTPLTRLPEALRAGGFRTAAFSTMGNIARDMGFERGFEKFDELFRDPAILAKRRRLDPAHEAVTDSVGQDIAMPLAEDLNEYLLRWLHESSGQDTFSFIWSIETHAPYSAPHEFRRFSGGFGLTAKEVERDILMSSGAQDRQGLIDLYDDEIFYNDHCIGQIVDHLKEMGQYDDSLIIIIGDHGDAFFEHQFYGHGHAPYDELIHVPLVIKFPRGEFRNRRVSALVELIDIFPTVIAAAAAGISPAEEKSSCLQGHDLIPLLQGVRHANRAHVFSETQATEVQNRYLSVRDLHWKYIYVDRPKRDARTFAKTFKYIMERRILLKMLRHPTHFLRGYFQGTNEYLFDLQADPEEKNNLAGKRPEVLSRYRQVLADWQRRNEKIAEQVGGGRQEYREDEQLRKHLEELGYM